MNNQAVNNNHISYIRLSEQPAALLCCESKGAGNNGGKSAKEKGAKNTGNTANTGNSGTAKQQGCYRLLADSLIIPLTGKDDLLLIQQAAHNAEQLGLRHLQFAGDGWNVERCWAFCQGYYKLKKRHGKCLPADSRGDISYRQLSAAEQRELDLRIHVAGWVNNISHQRLAESTIKLVMGDILKVLMYLPCAVIRLFT